MWCRVDEVRVRYQYRCQAHHGSIESGDEDLAMCVECLRDVEQGGKVMHVVASTILVGWRFAIAVNTGTPASAQIWSESSNREEQCDTRREEAALSC